MTRKMSMRQTLQTASAPGVFDRSARITPSWAEHGIARASSSVAMIRSRTVSRVLVTMVAMVSQPNPSTMGITALPVRPILLKRRSTRSARRGK